LSLIHTTVCIIITIFQSTELLAVITAETRSLVLGQLRNYRTVTVLANCSSVLVEY
jgi:hypothetical protein